MEAGGFTELPGGLRVVSEPIPGVRSVALGFWVAVGSRDEAPSLAGASHFLEHLLFKGTKNRTARQIAETFDAIGGEANAFSAREYTCFYARVLDRDLPLALEVLADMFLNALLSPAEIESERQVILEEIRMRDDNPEDLVQDLFTEALFPGHPLGRPVLGSKETVEALSRRSLVEFYRRHYLPSELVVAAAGRVEHPELVRMVEDRLAETRGGSKPKAKRPAPGLLEPRFTFLERPTEQAHLVIGGRALSRSDPRRYAMAVLSSVVGGGMSSRLFQRIREERGLVYSIYSFHSGYSETGSFGVYAGCHPSKAEEVLSLVMEELEQVAGNGLTVEEVERGKGHVRGSLVLSMEDPGGRMTRLGKAYTVGGEVLSLDEVLARIDSVTPEEVAALAAEVLKGPWVLAAVGPEEVGSLGDLLDAGGRSG